MFKKNNKKKKSPKTWILSKFSKIFFLAQSIEFSFSESRFLKIERWLRKIVFCCIRFNLFLGFLN